MEKKPLKHIADISAWQDGIDYDDLKKHFDGVILRASVTFTGGKGGSMAKDHVFETHYQELKKRGVAVGAYHYGCADTLEEARAEAAFFLSCLKGKQFELPVYYDVEDGAHQDKLTGPELTRVVDTFCQIVEKAGYYTGVYSFASWLNHKLDMDILKRYTVWVAHVNVSEPSVKANYDMWQYTWKYRLSDREVDANRLYKDFEPIIRAKGLNGFKAVPASRPVEPPAAKPSQQPETIYTVQPGDTLSGISKKFKVSLDSLVDINRIKNPNLIYPGQTLKLNGETRSQELKVGDRIKIKSGAKDLNTRGQYADFVHDSTYLVLSLGSDWVIFGPAIGGNPTGKTNRKYVERA